MTNKQRWKNNESLAIETFNDGKLKFDKVNYLKDELKAIDRQIIDLLSGLLEAQKVQIKSALNRDKNLFIRFQKKWITSAANQSANWHQSNLRLLYKKRKVLQIEYEKATGKYWQNKVKRLVVIISFLLLATFIISLILMGVFLALYLLPLWICLLFTYMYLQRKDRVKKI